MACNKNTKSASTNNSAKPTEKDTSSCAGKPCSSKKSK